MQNGGVVLVNTSLVGAGSTVTSTVTWNGGNGCLVVSAAVLPTVINLMLVGVGITNREVKVNSGAIVASGVYPVPLPAGSYCIHTSGTSSIALYAALMPLP